MRASSVCLALLALSWGCGAPPPEPALPPMVVPDSLKPPAPGSPGPPLLTLAPRAAASDAEPAEPTESAEPSRHRPPATGPVVPPPVIGRCLRSRLCEHEGLCSATDDGRCIAASDDDCRPSDACLGGRCTAKDGGCIAGSAADCRASWACKGWGRCHYDGNESCLAASESDCRLSTRCQRKGECSLLGGACVQTQP